MSDLNPSAPSQPPTDAAYKSEGNPVTSAPSEERASHQASNAPITEKRDPTNASSSSQEATASSLGRGVRGRGQDEEREDRTDAEVQGDQIRPPGEGDVATAVEQKPGAGGEQPDLASDLDRKKAEQADKREERGL
ncbi:hypothetical protein BJ170DRAFT_615388 [Xylariales sp. AK1849]|nr:hypothetical protein BJ170DRAFT_615388 [Xylariales sp. AK1849]